MPTRGRTRVYIFAKNATAYPISLGMLAKETPKKKKNKEMKINHSIWQTKNKEPERSGSSAYIVNREYGQSKQKKHHVRICCGPADVHMDDNRMRARHLLM